jgi:hypothetical protein
MGSDENRYATCNDRNCNDRNDFERIGRSREALSRHPERLARSSSSKQFRSGGGFSRRLYDGSANHDPYSFRSCRMGTYLDGAT